jgi:hypothetical protein
MAKLDDNAPVHLAGEAGGLLEWLDDDGANDEAQFRGLARAAARQAAPWPLSAAVDADAFLGSLTPLFRGETTLTALPFVLLMH